MFIEATTTNIIQKLEDIREEHPDSKLVDIQTIWTRGNTHVYKHKLIRIIFEVGNDTITRQY